MTDKITVLYVSIDPSLGGSVISLYSLIESVKDRVSPIVLFPEKGAGSDYFASKGIACLFHPFVKLYEFNANRLVDVWNHPWRWHRIKKLRIDFGCALYVKKALNGRKIDIVHTNTSPNNVGVYLSRILRAKHVWQVRECLDAHAQFPIYGGMPGLIEQINQADARIAISQYVRDHWKMVERNTFLIHDAVCHTNDAVYQYPKEKYVLFVSYYITEAKGARKAIMAFGQSRLCDEGFKLVFLGHCEMEYQVSLMDTAKKSQCDKAIEFASAQVDVKPFFINASALLMTSENEGFGRVTAEAMFYGCPVVAHASGGTLDIIEDGETGFLFSNTTECSDRLRKVCLTDQRQMCLKAQKFAAENFAVESYGSKVLKVYDSILTH